MLSTHLGAVGDRAAGFASAFGWEEAARTAGRLHDVGKASAAFQAYIRGKGPSPDHSSAGAEAALAAYPGPLGRILAFLVAGHLHERSGSKYDF
jgi:CRISPR-associated endonuclease/helicase Cas3